MQQSGRSIRRLWFLLAIAGAGPAALADGPTTVSAARPATGKPVAVEKVLIESDPMLPPLRGPGPVNETCADALPIAIGGSVAGDSTGGTPDTTPCAGAGTASPGVWYTFTGNGNILNAATCSGATWDTVLRVMTGSCGTLTCVAYNDDACGLQTRTPNFTSINGQQYWIYLSGFSATAFGAHTVTLTDAGPPPPPPANCVNAQDRTLPFVEMGDTTGAPANQAGVPACGPGATTPALWYKFLGSGNVVRATTCNGAAWDTVLSIYTGGCAALVCFASNDDNCGLQSTVEFPTVAGQEYWVSIRGFGATSFGPFTLSVGDLPPPCDLTAPGGSADEAEGDCGLPTDTINGGCNSAPQVFGTIACGVPVFGSSAYDPAIGFRDTDWYLFELAQDDTVTITVASEFPSVFGSVGGAAGPIQYSGDPATWCPQVTSITPFGQGLNDCMDTSVSATLTAGTWVIFVSNPFAANLVCGGSDDYVLTVTTGSPCPGGTDCNMNGMPDSGEIAANPALDCYNPAILQNPNVIGGPDGALDVCQCPGNFNRDPGVNSSDISSYLTGWLASVQAPNTAADIDCSGSTNSSDISSFLTVWLANINGNNPFDGCP